VHTIRAPRRVALGIQSLFFYGVANCDVYVHASIIVCKWATVCLQAALRVCVCVVQRSCLSDQHLGAFGW